MGQNVGNPDTDDQGPSLRLTTRTWIPPAGALCATLLFAICLLRICAAATLPVLYEEAHYWEWSWFPSLGYLDHPPMVSWLIRLTSAPFATQSSLILRLGSLVAGLLSPLVLCLLAWRLFRDRSVLQWTLILSLSLPVFNAVGFLTLPEAPSLLFHLLFLFFFYSAIERESRGNWVLAGMSLGMSLLSQLAACVTIGASVLFLVLSAKHRYWLRRKEPYLALALGLAVFSPFIYWNATHHWVGFSFQLWEKHQGDLGFGWGKPAEFAFEQLVNTVFLFLPVLGSLALNPARLPTRWRTPLRFVRIQAITALLFWFMVGTVAETHPNWTLLAYPAAVTCAAAFYVHDRSIYVFRNLKVLTALSVISFALFSFGSMFVVDHAMRVDSRVFGKRWSKKVALAQQRIVGWRHLATQLNDHLEQCECPRATLFTHHAELASLVSFYRNREIVVNLVPLALDYHVRGSAQRYYIPYEELVGQGGLFLGEETGPSAQGLQTIFEDVQELAPIDIECQGVSIKRYRLFLVSNLRRDKVLAYLGRQASQR